MMFVGLKRDKQFKLSLFAVFFSTMLSACGGSSGNRDTVKKNENQLPTVVITAIADAESGSEVRLTSTASDPDGTIASYQWSQKSGHTVTIRDKDQANASFTAPVLDTDSTLELELLVTDDKGGKAKDTITVKVKHRVPGNVNLPPLVSISAPDSVTSGTEVRMVSTAEDSDGTIASYQWLQKSGYAVTIRDKDQANASFTAPVLEGDTTLEFELVVTDNNGTRAVDTVSIKVKTALRQSAREYSSYKSCNVETARTVFESYQNTQSLASKVALSKWLCSAQNNVADELMQSIVNRFSVEGETSTVEQWKEANCSVEDKSYRGSRAAHALIQVADETTVATWAKCMQDSSDSPLVCYAKEQSDGVLVHVGIKPQRGHFVPSSAFVKNLSSNDVLPTTLNEGTTTVLYQRDDAMKSAYFELLGVDNQGVEYSCGYSMASQEQLEADACELVRQQSLEQGKITERDYIYYRNFDVVPLFVNSNSGTRPITISCEGYKQAP